MKKCSMLPPSIFGTPAVDGGVAFCTADENPGHESVDALALLLIGPPPEPPEDPPLEQASKAVVPKSKISLITIVNPP